MILKLKKLKQKKEKDNNKDDIKEVNEVKEVKEVDYEEIKFIIDNLPEEYFEYEPWRNVGWALADLKDEKYRELFHLWSSKYIKYDENECEKILDSANGQ